MDRKDKILNFIKSYISLAVAGLIGIVYITIDLLVFQVEHEPRIVITKAILYMLFSLTITSLLRRQGMLWGNNDEDFVITKKKYNTEIEDLDASDLDEFCEDKNEIRRIQLIKKKLKWAKLDFDKYEKGEYEIIDKQDLKKYSKRQIKAIIYCNHIDINIYDSDYLTKDVEYEKQNKVKNITQESYVKSKNTSSIVTGILTSLAFAYLTVSLATEISWANLFYSMLKVVSWIASGVVAMIGAYTFITITYKEILIDKTNKLKEYKLWKAKKDEKEKNSNIAVHQSDVASN
jgi:hypothetical protein